MSSRSASEAEAAVIELQRRPKERMPAEWLERRSTAFATASARYYKRVAAERKAK